MRAVFPLEQVERRVERESAGAQHPKIVIQGVAMVGSQMSWSIKEAEGMSRA
jgi:hypothetical protein